jgi:hypothetical protein
MSGFTVLRTAKSRLMRVVVPLGVLLDEPTSLALNLAPRPVDPGSARGVTPPKSAFTWAIEKPIEKDVGAAPEKTKTEPAIQMLRSNPTRTFQMSGRIGLMTRP